MFKKDKYHNCFKPFVQTTPKVQNKHGQKNNQKNRQEKLQEVIKMLEYFGWEQQNIEILRDSWFDLED